MPCPAQMLGIAPRIGLGPCGVRRLAGTCRTAAQERQEFDP
jgi:hypothetical protein